MQFHSNSVADTEHIASEFARSLSPGTCVALHGDLGAGKTQFVRGLVIALGGDGRQVSSPTYVLLHIYATPAMPVYHLDAYRVFGPDDFEQIGFQELLEQNAIVIVEWPSRVIPLLPRHTIDVTIETTGETTRQITIAAPPDRPDAA